LCVAGIALFSTTLFGTRLLVGVGVISLVYFTAGTIGLGSSPGVRLVEALRLRAPSLFTSRRTVSA
jgi:hypothetical protein